ncbi:TPA: glycosyltransferase family 2 protein [Streptococcus equi subsp. zooepidemicus]|uniref:Glycosyl transferase n=1 Tax=Streptococcus equi subsp. ruminatorum CECT 5772 TaxID=1051981 RepID=A0A922NXX1_9STRE|nr:glycosyltransferase family 2 protein [Streptococcus equi]KED05355.1 glycosyl transferase [Streptococcus equi subsp. ruminatorum CECT 5772]HEL0246064.1 glycosyltransferase family 2 protein [Streptococcus equi subsp. zooepidemicus]HEL1011328.1 glycosyltransferase family 2 protein [Streptococcus equi subsp. ruminatorum]HEL1023101.1 glycosyltransferase family 2 protein [Streptococcus equi subsp. ruminatorum CECT 5772]
MKKDLLVMIPAYNEEESIEKVVENIKRHFPQYDYVIINDGSSDRTSEICHHNHYNIIDLPENLGLSGAIQTGFKYAFKKGYAKALQFDADGQHLPEYIEALSDSIKADADCVIGSRFVSAEKNRSLRMMGNSLISFFIKLTTGKRITDPTSGMRMFNQELIRIFATNINYTPEPDTISYLIRQGYRVSEVQVQMNDRLAGQSYLTLSRSIKYMVHMFISIILIQNFRKR